jgi:hypothetical protein
LITRSRALRGIIKSINRIAVGINARRVESGIDDPNLVVLVEECLLIHYAGLDALNAFAVSQVRGGTSVEQRALLCNRCLLRRA